LGGAPLFGPIGSGVARALKGDIENSLKTFVKIYG
ncbi:MAG: toxin, partial [Rhodococcus sp. (in: high G+C Gram-positive bacteria)]